MADLNGGQVCFDYKCSKILKIDSSKRNEAKIKSKKIFHFLAEHIFYIWTVLHLYQLFKVLTNLIQDLLLENKNRLIELIS